MTVQRWIAAACAVFILGACASVSAAPDAQTAAWWRTTAALSGDDMEGRDTGSPGYDRAAAYVADRFQRAGLRPAGDGDTYFQRIRFRDIEVMGDGTSFNVTYANGATRALRFLEEISVTPAWSMPARIDAPLVFRGYCGPSQMENVRGAVVVCFGTRRTGQVLSAAQTDAATAAGAAALVRVDDIGFTIEPPRWPLAYARTVTLDDGAPLASGIPVLRLAAPVFVDLVARSGAGHDGADILARGARGESLLSFDFSARLNARFVTRERNYASDNVLAVLPGTDPALANEPVLLIAHLDGYGYGTPVNGDNLYNGALDDAAYVATLITFADARAGRGFRRPVIFAAVTAEEKGLWGSRWLAAHPTPGAPTPIAVLNLDQLRPLYPLRILTTLGLHDSTLGQTVRDIAGPMGVTVRADLEPERNLLRRTDHWPFMQRGVPAVSFLFGFDENDTEAHARYRAWYEHRYHAPQDDLTTPIDFQAQADFHRFYFALTEAVANADARPQWLPDSPNRPRE
ncbi:MAG: M28 family peptidase [Hyphomonadaceae bacterium]|nr:M28 family peptidase [Hyphomonadaceae bacterium]